MNCMKCGRELKDNGVFCSRCRKEMEHYPVKPNTVVQLPQRSAEPTPKKAPKKRELTPEEQLVRLRKSVRWLALLLAVSLLAFAFTTSVLLHLINTREEGNSIGQNYSTQQPASGI